MEATYEGASTLGMCGISVSVTEGLAKSFKKAVPQNSGSSPLGMAFGIAVRQVCHGNGLPQLPKAKFVRFVVEKGNKNNAQIKQDFEKLKLRELAPYATSLEFETKHSSRAIHLADFWALYSRRLANASMKGNGSDDLTQYLEPELKVAIKHVPHAMDINFGSVSQQIQNRKLLNVGTTRRF